MKNIKINKIRLSGKLLGFIFIIIVFNNANYFSQSKERIGGSSNLEIYFISKDNLIAYDTEKILNFKKNIPIGDSMKTLLFSDKIWFLFSAKGSDGLELFNIDLKDKKINKVTNRSFNKEDDRLYTIFTFNNKLLVRTNFSETENVWNFGMLIIDDKNNREEKYIPVREKSFVREIFINGDSLQIIVKPAKAKLNIVYYIAFWLPKGRINKYDYYDDGAPELYVYDKNFNLVRKEEFEDIKTK
jgi:hypothetical protein